MYMFFILNDKIILMVIIIFSYAQSEVILTADQAACLISDRGSEIMVELPGQQLPPANVGDVSLGKYISMKTCLFKFIENFITKNENFQIKSSDIFIFLLKT